MENDDILVGRILSRREALSRVAQAGLMLVAGRPLARVAEAQGGGARPVGLVVAPRLTEGPFFVDERMNRYDLTSGTTRPSVTQGAPLALALTVYRRVGAGHVPVVGAHVDVWHTDAVGVYSDETGGMNPENTAGQHWLRGYQVTDQAGEVHFRTIVPGWYPARTPHVHLKIRQYSAADRVTAEFTSQLFFREEELARVYATGPYAGRGMPQTTNATDGVYNDSRVDGRPVGDVLRLSLEPSRIAPGYRSSIALLIDSSPERAEMTRG